MGVANHPESPHASGRVRRLLLAVGAVAAICAIAASCVAWTAWRLPLDRSLSASSRPAMVFLAADGTPFARRGAYKEAPVDAATLPPLVTAAFVAVEDRHFYTHFGMDPAGTGRAALVNLVRGHVAQGGSTITQQLAKTYVGDERSYGRKLREMLVALALETRLTKNEILSRYLSTAYFGSGAYGLRAAARTYFDKAPEDLSLSEAAMLAGLLKRSEEHTS